MTSRLLHWLILKDNGQQPNGQRCQWPRWKLTSFYYYSRLRQPPILENRGPRFQKLWCMQKHHHNTIFSRRDYLPLHHYLTSRSLHQITSCILHHITYPPLHHHIMHITSLHHIISHHCDKLHLWLNATVPMCGEENISHLKSHYVAQFLKNHYIAKFLVKSHNIAKILKT